MPTWLIDLLSKFSTSVPGVAVMALGIVLLILGETGRLGTNQIRLKGLARLRLLGLVFIVFGAVILVALTYDATGNSAQFRADVSQWILSNWLILLVVVGVIILAVAIGWLGKFLLSLYNKQGFRIKAMPVSEYGEVKVRVENTGRGNPLCVAKIVQLKKLKSYGEIKDQTISLDEVNPQNQNLTWENGKDRCVIDKPRIVRLFELDNDINPKARIISGERTWGEFELEDGQYIVTVQISAVEDGTEKKLLLVEDCLLVSYRSIKWQGGKWLKVK